MCAVWVCEATGECVWGWGCRSMCASWTAAEKLELANHIKNGSWTYLRSHKIPNGRRVIRFTWVYKVKRDGRLKARLCV